MQIDVSGVVLNLDGSAVTDAGEHLSIMSVIINALLAQETGENIPGMEKMRRFQLAQKIHGSGGAVDLTAEEVVLIKSQVARFYAPLAVGRLYERLCI